MEQHRIDVRDIDPHRWCEDVPVFLDRSADVFYFPKDSIDRIGEPDEESGNYWLLDGRVEAEADQIEVDGEPVPVWTVRVGELVTRPARRQ